MIYIDIDCRTRFPHNFLFTPQGGFAALEKVDTDANFVKFLPERARKM